MNIMLVKSHDIVGKEEVGGGVDRHTPWTINVQALELKYIYTEGRTYTVGIMENVESIK